jgi:hypothetical protein
VSGSTSQQRKLILCPAYQDNNNPIWAYLSVLSTINLNTFFNRISDGVLKGQVDYGNLMQQISVEFFPWKDPQFIFGDVAFWIVAIMSIMAAAALFIGPEAEFAALGALALTSAAVQQISFSLAPGPANGLQSLTAMSKFAAEFGQVSRQQIESMANDTFWGVPDKNGRDVIDYMDNGTFIELDNLPAASDMEQFYKSSMVARTVNAQWRTQKIFTTFYRTNNSNDASGPNITRYYSDTDGGVYYTYQYTEKGVLKGFLDSPPSVNKLNDSSYGMHGSDVSKASALSWKRGGFNYTAQAAFEDLRDALDPDRYGDNATEGMVALDSYRGNGGAQVGSWTLPVCDMGTHNWNTQYGDKKGGMGLLPCCCGEFLLFARQLVMQ